MSDVSEQADHVHRKYRNKAAHQIPERRSAPSKVVSVARSSGLGGQTEAGRIDGIPMTHPSDLSKKIKIK
jgi:hypothetical protein